jgi:carbamoyltransferase
MMPPVTVIGINRTQDASICVVRPPDCVHTLQKERITRRKHHWGRLGDLPNLYRQRLPELSDPVDLVVECYSSDSEYARFDEYQAELSSSLHFRGAPRSVSISHHLAHLYSAFYPSPFSRAAVMVIDAQGSPVKHFRESFPVGSPLEFDLLEVSSFYRVEGGAIECMAKQLWDGDWDRPVGLGCFYYLLTRMIFPDGEGSEGKVMGLAPFGSPDSMDLPPLAVEDHQVFIPDDWIKLFGQRQQFRFGQGEAFQKSADLAAAGQLAFETALLQVVAWLHEQTRMDDLCFAGGTALNCSANGRLLREGPFSRMFIPPSPHDGGTALGCALYGLLECCGVDNGFRWVNDFLGPEPVAGEVEATIRDLPPELWVERPDDLAAAVVELLCRGRVVGLCQGRSESGPRALGNRSILADPRRRQMRDFINAKVKGREWFRPLAPLVLAGSCSTMFDIDRPSPFMQFAADVRPEYRDRLPAITHVDGTARLQTVEADNTPFLHSILDRFAVTTGCPVLLNTSLNEKGDPIVETPDEALACLTTTSMHALVMPPYIIRKRVEPPIPS